MEASRHLDSLKIIIASTPKTGNNWVKQLLAAAYHLPAQILTLPFRAAEAEALGPRWVAHEHFFPVVDLLEWAGEHHAIVVTTIRHPADVLLSFYHHVHNRQYGPRDQMTPLALAMGQDRKGPGEHTAEYVRQEFFYAVNQSLAWQRSGLSIVVRYEDMWRDPVTALTELTSQILPVGQDRILRAIEQCQIDKLRQLHDPEGKFYRRGTIGKWRTELPEEIIELFRSYEPYPRQLAALGYTMDPDDPLISAPAKPFAFDNPFDGLDHFDNGVPIPPIVEKLYLSLDPEIASRWDSVTDTSPDSFYDWLNSPADNDPYRNNALPVLTNFAAYVYSIDASLQKKYPDVYGRNRIAYAHWFAMHAGESYGFGRRAFSQPIVTSWADESDREVLASSAPAPETAQPPSLDRLRATANVDPHPPIAWPHWPPGFWPKVQAAAQKLLRRGLRWYINPIVEQQNRFNRAVIESQAALWNQISELHKHMSREEKENTSEKE